MAYEIPEELVPLFLDDDGKFTPDMWWWSFDTFFARLIAIGARKLREDGNGYPGDMTLEGWRAYLKSIEDDLSSYNTLETFENPEVERKAKDAILRFADRMGTWWD